MDLCLCGGGGEREILRRCGKWHTVRGDERDCSLECPLYLFAQLGFTMKTFHFVFSHSQCRNRFKRNLQTQGELTIPRIETNMFLLNNPSPGLFEMARNQLYLARFVVSIFSSKPCMVNNLFKICKAKENLSHWPVCLSSQSQKISIKSVVHKLSKQFLGYFTLS